MPHELDAPFYLQPQRGRIERVASTPQCEPYGRDQTCERPDVAPRRLGRPERPTGWKPHGIFAWLAKRLAEVWQEHGRDTMLHTAKTQTATFFESPNECAIYLLRSYCGKLHVGLAP